MFTKHEILSETAQIWAIPRPSWASKDEPPFTYALYCRSAPYQDGAVKVADVEVMARVPEGVDLLAAALKTLEDAKVAAEVTYKNECRKIDQQIAGLRQLAHMPEPDELEGEVEVVAPVGGLYPDGVIIDEYSDDKPF